MGEKSVLINLILFAIIVAVFLKLRSVLGRRTGNERTPFDTYASSDKLRQISNHSHVAIEKDTQSPDVSSDVQSYSQNEPHAAKNSRVSVISEGSALAQALTEIALIDRHFNSETFMSGACIAYETIVTAFAQSNLGILQSLLSEYVFKSFEAAIAERAARNATVSQTFIGITKAELKSASLVGHCARLTVRFSSELISCVKSRDDVVIEGDPVKIRKMIDIWTFERDVKGSNPNWRLVETSSGDSTQ